MRILIVNNNMHIGGVQKALVSLLWSIHGQHQVTLLLLWPEGPLMAQIPPDVRVLTADSPYRYLGMTRNDTRNLRDRMGRAFFGGVSRILGRSAAVRLMSPWQKPVGEFDVAISYLHNGGDRVFYGGCNEFVLNHVQAKRKMTFLHCDYLLCGADTPKNREQYGNFDAIAACSRGCAESFCQANPHLADRVQVVENCHRFDRIVADAGRSPVCRDDDRIRIVTVARLGREKGVPRAAEAIAMLGDLGKTLHLHIVGDGVERQRLDEIIREKDLDTTVTLHGELENPYGWIRGADLMLIPSVSEAAPLVIGEAACLGTPILTTRTSSAKEMVEDTGLGWVCDNSVEGIRDGLERLLREPECLREKRRELESRSWDNARAAAAFEELIRQ